MVMERMKVKNKIKFTKNYILHTKTPMKAKHLAIDTFLSKVLNK